MRVDPKHYRKGADKRQGRLRQIFQEVVRRFADQHQVGGNAAQNLARLGSVKEGKGEFLDVVKEGRAHGCFHADAQPVAKENVTPFQARCAKGHEGKGKSRPCRCTQVAFGQVGGKDAECRHGNGNLKSCVEQNGQQVQREQEPLFVIVAAQRFEANEEIFELIHRLLFEK